MKFMIRTLGCKVNTYESNVMKDLLINAGYHEVVSQDECDILIINTCTVTNTADNKSLKIIRNAVKHNPNMIIVVCGCLPQVNVDKIKQLKDIAIIIGNKYKSEIVNFIKEYLKNKKQIIKIEDIRNTTFENMCLNNFDRTRAFVKIEDGCDNFCSYCIIPYSRGNVRSKEPIEVIDEIKHLVNEGHKEVVLTGIHTGHYGSDLKDYSFYMLLKDILKIEGLERLRISSIELNEITDEIIQLMAGNNILVDHMHIPLQAGSDKILKLMNRKYDLNYFKKKINKLRDIRPNISITTDVIVGFPGETEEDFQKTISTCKEINFSKIHVFPYSERRGTKSALMEEKLSEEIKKERSRRLVMVSKDLEVDYMNKFLNKEVTFIPEVYKDGYIIGHTGNYLLVKSKGNVNLLHQNVKVKICEIDYPYVLGIIIN